MPYRRQSSVTVCSPFKTSPTNLILSFIIRLSFQGIWAFSAQMPFVFRAETRTLVENVTDHSGTFCYLSRRSVQARVAEALALFRGRDERSELGVAPETHRAAPFARAG